MNMGNCSLWSWIIPPAWVIYVIYPDSIGLLSKTSTWRFSFRSWSGIWSWWAKSSSINAIPVELQSISACEGICWLFTVNVQVLTQCVPPINPSNTSTLLTERREIPKDLKAFKTKHFLSTKAPSCLGWPNLFPIPQEPVPVPISSTSAPAAWKVRAFFLATHSSALWLNPPQYKHLPSVNLFTISSAAILLLPSLRSIGTDPVNKATFVAGAPAQSFGGAEGLGEEAKPVPPHLFCTAFSARYCRIWLSCFWPTVTEAGSSSGISLYLEESFVSLDNPIRRAFRKAEGFQSTQQKYRGTQRSTNRIRGSVVWSPAISVRRWLLDRGPQTLLPGVV